MGQLKPVREGNRAKICNSPFFDVIMIWQLVCLLNVCIGILATHTEGNTVGGVLSHCTSPMETELYEI